MKRIGVLLLTLAMLFSLAACGVKDTQTTNAEEKQGTEQTASGTAANENQPAADLQKPEDKTTTPDAAANGDKQEETKTDDTKKDEQKADTAKKDDVKQDEQKPADTTKDTTPESKTETPSYGNGSLTTSQVKEMQRWYGVSADGQWGAGSAKAAGGRTADEAWAYYQQNKKDTTPEETTKPADKPDDSSAGGTTTPPTQTTEPAKPTKADIDCAAAIAAGNAYAESLGFEIWDGCRSYFPPIYLERDCPESCWNQEWVESALRSKIDYIKSCLEADGTWFAHVDGKEGEASAVNCMVRWNGSANRHEIYVYY
jgi:hypothetical protein